MKLKFGLLLILTLVISLLVGCTPHSYYTVNGTTIYTPIAGVDSYTFQQAMNALPITGGTLLLKNGHYKFETTVTRKITNVIIIGESEDVYIYNNGVTPLFAVGGDNWTFLNLRLDRGFIDFGRYANAVTRNVVIEDIVK